MRNFEIPLRLGAFSPIFFVARKIILLLFISIIATHISANPSYGGSSNKSICKGPNGTGPDQCSPPSAGDDYTRAGWQAVDYSLPHVAELSDGFGGGDGGLYFYGSSIPGRSGSSSAIVEMYRYHASDMPPGQPVKESFLLQVRSTDNTLYEYGLVYNEDLGLSNGLFFDSALMASTSSAGIRRDIEYSSRGNIARVVETGTNGTLRASTASYPATCSNRKTCNKPDWVEDAKGNRTEMEYDPVHGGMTRKIFPADAQGRRHEVRYTYEAIQPMVRNASGQLAPGPSVWVKKAEYTCTNSAFAGPSPTMACTTSTDLVSTIYEYGNPSMANNLWLRGVAVTAFVPNLGVYQTRRTCYEYDAVGRLKATISPEAGLSVCPQ